jgi:hypothetical protein
MSMKIGIIGGGWSGCHLAICLAEKGHSVTIIERNTDIFQAVSGNFGIRLHKGPHYPRSLKTRERCRITHKKFCDRYPELVVPHEYSVYALGTVDANGNPPKVTKEQFTDVCFEDPTCRLVDLDEFGYTNLFMAADMEEPSVVVGSKLREIFREYLRKADVTIIFNFEVIKIKATTSDHMVLSGVQNRRRSDLEFERVINASGYNPALLNSNIATGFPFRMETMYQPCLALVYTDTQPSSPMPFSFIVMDGWFPCIMPYVEDDAGVPGLTVSGLPSEPAPATARKYILTHGSYTIMASCSNPEDAYGVLNSVTDEFIETRIRPLCEREINRFWPCFSTRFRYETWKGEVLCKLKTEKEFRGSVTYAGPYGVIHVIPGKISNVFDAEEETMVLLEGNPDNLLIKNGYKFVKGGVMDLAGEEITELPHGDGINNTSALNTFAQVSELPLDAISSPGRVNTENAVLDSPSVPIAPSETDKK